ncbi:MAG: hypothetical protein AB8B97_06085 [Granulosicoccus sp.]
MSVIHTDLDTKLEFCLYLLSIRARRGDLFSAIRLASESEKSSESKEGHAVGAVAITRKGLCGLAQLKSWQVEWGAFVATRDIKINRVCNEP